MVIIRVSALAALLFGCGGSGTEDCSVFLFCFVFSFWRQFEHEYEFFFGLFVIRDWSVQLLQHKGWKRRAS